MFVHLTVSYSQKMQHFLYTVLFKQDCLLEQGWTADRCSSKNRKRKKKKKNIWAENLFPGFFFNKSGEQHLQNRKHEQVRNLSPMMETIWFYEEGRTMKWFTQRVSGDSLKIYLYLDEHLGISRQFRFSELLLCFNGAFFLCQLRTQTPTVTHCIGRFCVCAIPLPFFVLSFFAHFSHCTCLN